MQHQLRKAYMLYLVSPRSTSDTNLFEGYHSDNMDFGHELSHKRILEFELH